MFYEVNPVVLKGENVRLEPLSQNHAQGLFNRGQEAADWEFLPRSCFVDMADTRQWIDQALEAPNQVPFAIARGLRKHRWDINGVCICASQRYLLDRLVVTEDTFEHR